MAKRSEFSKFMKKQEKKEKALAEKAKQEALENEAPKESVIPSDLGKSTSLVFFRQYNTYQALLEVFPKETLSVNACFSKTILYIMRWFRGRLRESTYEEYPEIAFLKEDYPLPENYADFRIENAGNINGLDFIDLETAYLPEKEAWLVCLTEPDNGNDKKDIQGRTFTTEIMVYKQEKSVVLGVRESCREPKSNTIDATVYRPGFIRDMFFDPDLILGEYGLKKEYAFGIKPILLNGKSGEACEMLMENLISSGSRQMPVLFIPETYYLANEEEVDHKTRSLLGFAHIVVWQNTCRKLFAQVMQNEEFADVAEEGKMIFYRTNYMQEYPVEYFDPNSEEILEQIKLKAQREPLRKNTDYRGFAFKPSWWEVSKTNRQDLSSDAEIKEAYESEISRLNQRIRDFERDNSALQSKINELNSENDKMDAEILSSFNDLTRKNALIEEQRAEIKELKDKNNEQKKDLARYSLAISSLQESEKERYEPIIHMAPLGKDKKEDILKWIKDYYSDLLVIHAGAEKSFMDDKRNIDWHRFCMMIHYLAGYTKYRNAGGMPLDSAAAREYDPEESAYTVTPVSSGALGAVEIHKDKYTILINGVNGKTEEALLDLHLKYGKGMDDNMIRIYFHYVPELKKSVIGYMPGHLPTRKDGH